MKVLHCCLAAFYIDRYGYQENILPKIHKADGHKVEILASTENYIDKRKLGYVKPGSYMNENGIKVTRLSYINFLIHFFSKKIRLYNGLYNEIDNFKPDVIFLHDVQFLGILDVIKYKKNNPEVRIMADGHTDYINSAKNFLSKNFLHGIFYKKIIGIAEPYIEKFYATLPIRKSFMVNEYKIPENKISLLPFGVDDSNINFSDRKKIRNKMRKKLSISRDDFVIISGGKINEKKKIIELMKAFSIKKHDQVKLIIFGSVDSSLKKDFENLCKNQNIIFLSWIDSNELYKYFFASDIAFFPGTHSVIWEKAIGLGVPCIFKKWRGIGHVDIGGNCKLINSADIDTLSKIINEFVHDKIYFEKMKKHADKGKDFFLYSRIAKICLQ